MPRNGWPSPPVKRALRTLFLICSVIVIALGVTVRNDPARFATSGKRHQRFLALPIDALPVDILLSHHGAELLVVLGEPLFFVLAIAALALVAGYAHRYHLAFVVVIAPIVAIVLTEVIAKPAFHRSAGAYLAYPSGHVTATTAIVAATALTLRCVAGRRTGLVAAPILSSYAIGSMLGVIILHMHDMVDAVGGLAVGAGIVALGASTLTATGSRLR